MSLVLNSDRGKTKTRTETEDRRKEIAKITFIAFIQTTGW